MLTNAHRPWAHIPVRDLHHPMKFPRSRAPSPLISLGTVFGGFLCLSDCGSASALPVGQWSVFPWGEVLSCVEATCGWPGHDAGHGRLLKCWTKGKVTGRWGGFFCSYGDPREANKMTEPLAERIKQKKIQERNSCVLLWIA